MNQIPVTQQPYNTGTPLTYYNNGSAVATNNGQPGTVSVSTPTGTQQIYNYPTTSLYDPNTKQASSGVNIYIYNPSAIGGPSSNSVANATYAMPASNPVAQAPVQNPIPSAPMMMDDGVRSFAPNQTVSIANTPISGEQTQNTRKKKVVELTDEYIKSLENYLRSPNESDRRTAITDIINRYEEDSSRYDDPALTALLNIALQDPKASNRMAAMSVISAEQAHGDANTIKILNNLQTSTKVNGQEAKMAKEAALKASQNKIEIIDNDPPRVKSEEK